MTTFADVIAKPGIGVALGVDVSFDYFATVTYRYGTVSGKLDGTNEYDARIINMGKLERGLGDGHNVTAATTSLTFRNEDFVVDWMANRSTYDTTVFKSQWRVFVVAWEPSAPGTLYQKTVGIFSTMDNPERRATDILVTLADAALGDAFEFRMTPTIADILSSLQLDLGDGLYTAGSDEAAMAEDAHIPLVFGKFSWPILARKPHATSSITNLGLILYATRDTVGGLHDWTAYDLKVMGSLIDPGFWEVKRLSCTVDGLSWYVYYIKLDCSSFATVRVEMADSAFTRLCHDIGFSPPDASWVTVTGGGQSSLPAADPITRTGSSAGPGTTVVDPPLTASTYEHPAYVVSEMFTWAENQGTGNVTAKVYPGSAVTYTATTPSSPVYGVSYDAQLPVLHTVDTINDMLATYAQGSAGITIDSASFAAVKAARPTSSVSGIIGAADFAEVQGTVQVQVGGTLRKALTSICGFTGFDLFTNWSGAFKLVAETNTFAELTDTFATLDEVLFSDLVETTPNPGERHGFINRTFFGVNGIVVGPVDDAASITRVGRIFPRTIDATWAPIEDKRKPFDAEGLVAMLGFAYFSMKVRPTLRFSYPLEALNVEIGDYITASWTRGGGSAVFTNSIFRVEGLTLDAVSAQVAVTLSWADDLRSDLPYLLDDETYLLRATPAGISASGGGVRAATVTDGSDVVTVASDVYADDIDSAAQAGDIFIMKDASSAGFERFRAVRIASVSGNTLYLEPASDLDFGTAGAHVILDWEIWAGDENYPTQADVAVGVQYPNGNTPYGRTSNSAGQRYNTDDSWKLKAG